MKRSAQEWDSLIDGAVARGDYREAIELCDGAIEEHPDQLSFLANRGLYQQDAGLSKEAEATFLEVLAKDPTHSEAQQNYSNLLLDQKRNEEAEARLREWFHQSPDVANLLFNLSVAALRRGNKQQALEALGEVLRLDATFVEEARKEYVDLLEDRDFKAVLATKKKDRARNPFPWYLPSRYTTRPAPVHVGKRFPALKSKSAIRLHPRGRGPLPQDASKLGGVFLSNGKTSWPMCKQHGTAYTAVLQLRAADVPHFPFPKGKNLFQLMWCARDHETSSGDAPKIEARWLSTKNLGRSSTTNPPARRAERHPPTADSRPAWFRGRPREGGRRRRHGMA